MKIQWNKRNISQVTVRSDGLLSEIDKRVRSIEAAAGDGFIGHTNPGRTRHRGAVVTGDIRAIRSNRKHNTLIRNLDAGR